MVLTGLTQTNFWAIVSSRISRTVGARCAHGGRRRRSRGGRRFV